MAQNSALTIVFFSSIQEYNLFLLFGKQISNMLIKNYLKILYKLNELILNICLKDYVS